MGFTRVFKVVDDDTGKAIGTFKNVDQALQLARMVSCSVSVEKHVCYERADGKKKLICIVIWDDEDKMAEGYGI